MQREHFEYLFQQYLRKTCTPQEKAEFLSMLEQPEYHPLLNELSDRYTVPANQAPPVDEEAGRQILSAILQVAKPPVRRLVPYWTRYAAAILLLMLAGIYFWAKPKLRSTSQQPTQTTVQDVRPGSNKATLTLADGTTVTLNSDTNRLISEGIRQQGSQLQYAGKGSELSYNILTTPRGGQFSLVLPDGTKVWLNAASSLRYPVNFSGNERVVTVTGEAYFEVAQDAAKPFMVKAPGDVTVKVLGTAFNINAYTDEQSINTTLIEGAVLVNNTALQPGQQAQVSQRNIDIMKTVNLAKVTAWKNGLFNFEDAELREVMRQLSRWYDVEIVYGKDVPETRFGGKIGRNLNLSQVLEVLEGAGVQFRMEGSNKLIIE